MKKIAIVDYGVGNIRSVYNAVNHVGFAPELVSCPEKLQDYSNVIVPGVGHFGYAVELLRKSELDQAIHFFASKGKPLFGICVGMQMLFDSSEESPETPGLALIKGAVRKLPGRVSKGDFDTPKLPNIGWYPFARNGESKFAKELLDGIELDSTFYFVHSYSAAPMHLENLVGTVNFKNVQIAALVAKDNIFGSQFHPEKSGAQGLLMLRNFCSI